MAAVEKGILSAMTGATPWSNWDKPHDALDPKGNPAVESRLNLSAGYDFEVTLMMSGAGTFGRVRFRQPAVHNVSYAGPWHTALDLRKTTVQTLVRTATDLILEQDAQRGLGLVKYKPIKGVVDIEVIRRALKRPIFMVEPNTVNPRSSIVGRNVTWEGYSFHGSGRSYSGDADVYYGQLRQTPAGWVFETHGGKPVPVGSSEDVLEQIRIEYRKSEREMDDLRMSSN
jgi:hypothetical protein